mgnify:CR=1 FL=1
MSIYYKFILHKIDLTLSSKVRQMQTSTVIPVSGSELIQDNVHSENLPEILNQVAFLRIWDVCDCNKPGKNPLIPVGRTKWLEGVKLGIYPSPIKIGKSNCWKSEDIKKLIIELGQTA